MKEIGQRKAKVRNMVRLFKSYQLRIAFKKYKFRTNFT